MPDFSESLYAHRYYASLAFRRMPHDALAAILDAYAPQSRDQFGCAFAGIRWHSPKGQRG